MARSGLTNAHLVVIGDGPEKDEVRRVAAELGIAERVHLLGFVSDEDKYRALSVADVFVSASQHEGFGLMFLEALASGLPVVCYDDGGQTDFLATGETGYVVKLNDTTAFAAALADLAGSVDHAARSAGQPPQGGGLFHRALRRAVRGDPGAGDRPPLRRVSERVTPCVELPASSAPIQTCSPRCRACCTRCNIVDPTAKGRSPVRGAVFGHRRLSIIDLEGGRQPLTNADQSVWLVCNGEIYNYRELRAASRGGRSPFRTHSDCEVILGLYERHGDDCSSTCAACSPSRSGTLVAAGSWPPATTSGRSLSSTHSATRPFAVRVRDQGPARLRSRRCGPSTSRALDQYLTLRLIAPPLSMFEGIHKLPPGHKLVLEEGRSPRSSRTGTSTYEPKSHGRTTNWSTSSRHASRKRCACTSSATCQSVRF